MSTRIVSYSNTALAGTGKTGVVKPDANNYYTMVVGALGIQNSVGDFYRYDPAKALFDESSAFQRRIRDGALYGECGHPKIRPGENTRDYIARCMQVTEENVACHFRRIYLEHGTVRDQQGRPVIAIMAELTPAGPHMAALQRALDNPDQNVAFSIRSFTENFVQGGRTYKDLKTIITFDWVLEPGISVAKKWYAPALESFGSTDVVPPMLEEIRRQQMNSAVGFESGKTMVDEVAASLGWKMSNEGLMIPDRPSIARPLSSSW